MKIIKTTLIILFGLFITFTFNSCSDDDYSLDKFIVSLATVNPIDIEQGTYSLTLDNGTTLWPAASNMIYKPKSNQRVFLNYTLLSGETGHFDHYIKVNYIRDILTKEVVELTPSNEKEIGNDPIKILRLWEGDNYLNIHFGYNVGGGQIKHTVNLVRNTLNNQSRDENKIFLEFRHNSNNDIQKYGEDGYVAFDLKPFQIKSKKSVDFIIKVKDYNSEIKEYQVTYNYGEPNSKKVIEFNEILNNNLTIE